MEVHLDPSELPSSYSLSEPLRTMKYKVWTIPHRLDETAEQCGVPCLENPLQIFINILLATLTFILDICLLLEDTS